MRRIAGMVGVFLLATAASTWANTGSQVLQPSDIFDLEWADNPTLSPDGKRIVYQRNHYDIMTDRRRSHLWLIDVDRGQQRPLTSGSGSDGAPVWSADGERLAWVSARDKSSQIWTRWLDSGQTAVISQLTESPSNLAFSPDGKWLAFTMRVRADTKPLASLPKKPRGAEWAPAAKLIDGIGYRADGAGYIDPAFTHVFVMPSDGGSPRQVTRGDFQYRGAPVWSRDGKSLIVVSNHDPDWELETFNTEIFRIDVATGAATALTNRKGPDQSPALSPDGRHLAYTGFDDRRLGHQISRLYVLDLTTGERRELTGDFDYGVQSPQWDGSGRGIFFAYDRHGSSHIAWTPARGGAIQSVTDAFGGTAMGRPYPGGNFSVAGDRVAYTHGTAYRPAEVAVGRRGGRNQVLTGLNDDVLGHRQLGEVEELWLRSSADNLNVHAWIVKPPGFDANKKYPLILEIHGGPFANYGPRFAPETQLYAAAGYVVLYVNPRGSTSYGEDFANEIHHNYPSQDYDDLISAVDATIAKGYVDPGKLYVTGGSGGGVLTAWIIGHTDRFKAAVVAKPVINWASFVLTADFYPVFSRYWFPMLPWEEGGPEHYWKRSPLAYVGNVTTPTMLITGENDYRTPISETEQYYQALKLREVETVMVRIPEAAHGINARPSQMLAQVLNTIAWFQRYPGTAGN